MDCQLAIYRSPDGELWAFAPQNAAPLPDDGFEHMGTAVVSRDLLAPAFVQALEQDDAARIDPYDELSVLIALGTPARLH